MAVLALEEGTDSLSPSVGSLSAEDGQTTRTWQTPLETPVVNPGDVLDTENWLVGYTNTAVNTAKPGALNRAPPLADPHRPNWFVRKLNSTRGVVNRDRTNTEGFNRAQNKPGQVGLLPTPNEADITRPQPVLSQFTLYCTYQFNVSYGPRPYPVVGDDQISVYNQSAGDVKHFFWPDRLTHSGYNYADEWKRFCTTPHFAPQNDYVTAQQGAYVFRCAGGAAPNGYVFTGMPRVHLRTSVVTITWYGVPLRYVLSPNSYIRRFRGLVNQYAWYESPSDATKKVFGPGQLMYLNYDYTDYESPLNVTETAFSPLPSPPGNTTILMAPRLCNVTFTFLHAERKATNPIVPAWGGWVTDGHNALPYLGLPGQFFYATGTGPTVFGVGDPNSWFPSFSSFPIELLFTDPDCPQPAGFPPPGGGGV